MNIGSLKHKITIQRPGRIPDNGGGWTEGYTDYKTIAANVRPMTAKQLIEAEQAQFDVTHRVTIRFRTDITRVDRIVYKGREFDIKTLINEDEANRALILLCVERGK